MDERFDYLLRCLREDGAHSDISDVALQTALKECIALDNTFIEQSSIQEGAFYDDDAAYAFIAAGLARAVGESRSWANAFVDDYLSYNEAYLEERGEIEWD